jgi:uncharacterized protein (DUF2225 family)
LKELAKVGECAEVQLRKELFSLLFVMLTSSTSYDFQEKNASKSAQLEGKRSWMLQNEGKIEPNEEYIEELLVYSSNPPWADVLIAIEGNSNVVTVS